MDLKTYLKDKVAASFAREIGVAPAFVSQWVTGLRRVPAEHCPAIERATGGQVLCEDLRPDIDWTYLRTTGCRKGKKAA